MKMHIAETEERYFSLAEMARILGYERSTIYSRVRAGRIKTVRVDGAKRVTRSELLRYVGAAVQPAHDTESADALRMNTASTSATARLAG
jgi:excisionase family DNA binding protein